MKKPRKPQLTNYKDAVFAFPEGTFKVRPPGEPTNAERVESSSETTTYNEIVSLLKDTQTLLDHSTETYADIVEFLINDLELLKKRIKKQG